MFVFISNDALDGIFENTVLHAAEVPKFDGAAFTRGGPPGCGRSFLMGKFEWG